MRNKRLSTTQAAARQVPSGIAIVVTLLALLLSPLRVSAAETNTPPAVAGSIGETNSQEILRAYLQLQEQLRSTQLAIEQNRKEAREAAAQNAEVLSERLRGIEQALATQRSRELEAMQSSNRAMLMVAGAFAGVGCLVMMLGAYFQWRTTQGLTGLTGILPRALPSSPTLAALGPGETQLVGGGPAGQSSLRLLGALEQLEKRIYELEHTTRTPLNDPLTTGDDAKGGPPQRETETGLPRANGKSAERGESADSENHARVEMLLGKGISMLNLDQAEAAIECFDEVLALDPQNAEVLVRKGLALERLQLLDKAIECYDGAIAANGSLTVAYLHKGGLFNRMQRYDEALACYEQALRTQERRGS